jgi:hypothetical protein
MNISESRFEIALIAALCLTIQIVALFGVAISDGIWHTGIVKELKDVETLLVNIDYGLAAIVGVFMGAKAWENVQQGNRASE